MFSKIFYTLIFFFVVTSPLVAQSFSYRFTLPDNTINFHFTALELPTPATPVPPPNPTETALPTPAASAAALVLTYQLTSAVALPPDLPLVVAVYDERVLLTVDSLRVNLPPEQVTFDLAGLDLAKRQALPVFYQNRNLGNFHFRVIDLQWLTALPQVQAGEVALNDLLVLREKDQTLTVLIKVAGDSNWQNSYRLVCLDDRGIETYSAAIVRSDHFLWPGLLFDRFSPNHRGELIFKLASFACHNQVYAVDSLGNSSSAVSIIEMEDLQI